MSAHIAVTLSKVKGSAPREVGATMHVHADHITGSIGGGALEWEAMRIARDMLRDGAVQLQRTFPLGPDLGQCCGGVVRVDFTAGALGDTPAEPPVWIWGAGHVGRAIAAMLAPFSDKSVMLVDVAADRMPPPMGAVVSPLVAADPVRVVPRAPQDARHLIATYSHDLDLALCDAILRHGFASCGLIGSATKWTRFRKRLASMGHSEAEISRITCPIGDPSLGKHPQAIAVGVVAALLSRSNPRALGGQSE
jgi:xanthine dehydrogenase accessory factor